MEFSKQEWKDILSPVQDQEIQEAVKDTDMRVWEDPRETHRGRLEELNVLEDIDRWISRYEEPEVLEVGSSQGYTTQEIAESNPEADVSGIDIHADFQVDGNYFQASALDLPFADNSYDLVVAPNSLGLITWKGIATRAGGRQAKRTDIYNDLWDDLGVDEKSSLSTNASFTGGEAYKELFIDKVLEEAGRVLNTGGRFALVDGENYMVATRGRDNWALEEVVVDDDSRYSSWEDRLLEQRSGYVITDRAATD